MHIQKLPESYKQTVLEQSFSSLRRTLLTLRMSTTAPFVSGGGWATLADVAEDVYAKLLKVPGLLSGAQEDLRLLAVYDATTRHAVSALPDTRNKNETKDKDLPWKGGLLEKKFPVTHRLRFVFGSVYSDLTPLFSGEAIEAGLKEIYATQAVRVFGATHKQSQTRTTSTPALVICAVKTSDVLGDYSQVLLDGRQLFNLYCASALLLHSKFHFGLLASSRARAQQDDPKALSLALQSTDNVSAAKALSGAPHTWSLCRVLWQERFRDLLPLKAFTTPFTLVGCLIALKDEEASLSLTMPAPLVRLISDFLLFSIKRAYDPKSRLVPTDYPSTLADLIGPAYVAIVNRNSFGRTGRLTGIPYAKLRKYLTYDLQELALEGLVLIDEGYVVNWPDENYLRYVL